ncbi:hypothetical protein K402DRAFT_69443 [Aulographum hederae CBS 113979]|uniref:Myb-like domain-containing protein n=1 Tax=Aulographum hederae CBS 113979 TaxID=1176131 RepID=A0A6G1HF42_9PEZI|nr:hypothetical protein K402DRAFT_69443 [Aulographum hederae CBS 113979]
MDSLQPPHREQYPSSAAEEEEPVDLERERQKIDHKLKSTFESIFAKYGKDFSNTGDEIDLVTGEIVVNNGHLAGMREERDVGRDEDDDAHVMLREFSVVVGHEEDEYSDDDGDEEYASEEDGYDDDEDEEYAPEEDGYDDDEDEEYAPEEDGYGDEEDELAIHVGAAAAIALSGYKYLFQKDDFYVSLDRNRPIRENGKEERDDKNTITEHGEDDLVDIKSESGDSSVIELGERPANIWNDFPDIEGLSLLKKPKRKRRPGFQPNILEAFTRGRPHSQRPAPRQQVPLSHSNSSGHHHRQSLLPPNLAFSKGRTLGHGPPEDLHHHGHYPRESTHTPNGYTHEHHPHQPHPEQHGSYFQGNARSPQSHPHRALSLGQQGHFREPFASPAMSGPFANIATPPQWTPQPDFILSLNPPSTHFSPPSATLHPYLKSTHNPWGPPASEGPSYPGTPVGSTTFERVLAVGEGSSRRNTQEPEPGHKDTPLRGIDSPNQLSTQGTDPSYSGKHQNKRPSFGLKLPTPGYKNRSPPPNQPLFTTFPVCEFQHFRFISEFPAEKTHYVPINSRQPTSSPQFNGKREPSKKTYPPTFQYQPTFYASKRQPARSDTPISQCTVSQPVVIQDSFDQSMLLGITPHNALNTRQGHLHMPPSSLVREQTLDHTTRGATTPPRSYKAIEMEATSSSDELPDEVPSGLANHHDRNGKHLRDQHIHREHSMSTQPWIEPPSGRRQDLLRQQAEMPGQPPAISASIEQGHGESLRDVRSPSIGPSLWALPGKKGRPKKVQSAGNAGSGTAKTPPGAKHTPVKARTAPNGKKVDAVPSNNTHNHVALQKDLEAADVQAVANDNHRIILPQCSPRRVSHQLLMSPPQNRLTEKATPRKSPAKIRSVTSSGAPAKDPNITPIQPLTKVQSVVPSRSHIKNSNAMPSKSPANHQDYTLGSPKKSPRSTVAVVIPWTNRQNSTPGSLMKSPKKHTPTVIPSNYNIPGAIAEEEDSCELTQDDTANPQIDTQIAAVFVEPEGSVTAESPVVAVSKKRARISEPASDEQSFNSRSNATSPATTTRPTKRACTAGLNNGTAVGPSNVAAANAGDELGDSVQRKRRRRTNHAVFSHEDDTLLLELKEERNLAWDRAQAFFPQHSVGRLQYRYYNHLRPYHLNLGGNRSASSSVEPETTTEAKETTAQLPANENLNEDSELHVPTVERRSGQGPPEQPDCAGENEEALEHDHATSFDRPRDDPEASRSSKGIAARPAIAVSTPASPSRIPQIDPQEWAKASLTGALPRIDP